MASFFSILAVSAALAGTPNSSAIDESVIASDPLGLNYAAANRTVMVRGGMQTDSYASESLARSMLQSIVFIRLSRECHNRFNSSVIEDTIDYRMYLDGTTASGRYVASTPQASGRCR